MSEPDPPKPLRTLAEMFGETSGVPAGGCPKCGCRDFRPLGGSGKEICRHCGGHVRQRKVKQ